MLVSVFTFILLRFIPLFTSVLVQRKVVLFILVKQIAFQMDQTRNQKSQESGISNEVTKSTARIQTLVAMKRPELNQIQRVYSVRDCIEIRWTT